MEGGLEAKVNEGGKHLTPSVFFPSHSSHSPPVDADFFSSSVTSLSPSPPFSWSSSRICDRAQPVARFLRPSLLVVRCPAGVANYCEGHFASCPPLGMGLSVSRCTREVHARCLHVGVPHSIGSGADVPGSETAKSPQLEDASISVTQRLHHFEPTTNPPTRVEQNANNAQAPTSPKANANSSPSPAQC